MSLLDFRKLSKLAGGRGEDPSWAVGLKLDPSIPALPFESVLIYAVVYPSAKAAPSKDQIVAGLDVDNTAAVWSGYASAPISTGTEVFNWPSVTTGLTSSTSYRAAFVRIVNGSASNVEVSPAWTTSGSGVTGTSATTNANDTSSATGVVLGAITVNSPVQYKTFQRSGSTGSITGISITTTGVTDDIEASFNGGAYVTIASAVAAGTTTGLSLTSQAQGQGSVSFRKKAYPSVTATVSDVGIGDVFVVAGDSIAEGRGTSAQSYTHGSLKATKFTQADAWGNGNDGIDTGTSSGSHWPLLATQIMADQSVPVAFISVGTGSTDVAGSANQWAKNNSAYAEMTAQVTASGVNGVKGVLFHLGPNAVVNASTLSKATYNTAIDTLATDVAADIAGAPKIHVTIFGEVTTGSPPDRRTAIDNIRAAIIEAIGDNSNVEPGPCLVDQDYTDGVHPQSNTHLGEVAGRWWVALDESLYGGSGGRGPRFVSAQWNGARTDLTVVFDRVLKTGLSFGTGAWIVSDNGTPMTVTGVAYHGSNTSAVVLTTSAAASGPAGTTTVSLASSNDAAGVVIPKSTDITMPSGAAIQIPAEPIYAQAVGETVTGTSATTNANDTSAASGAVGSSVSGSSATTNANDTSSASGTTTVVGSSATANANDVGAASGTTTVVGTSTSSNANDTASAIGYAGAITGTSATTNVDDASSASGTAKQSQSAFSGGAKKKKKYDHLDPEWVKGSIKQEEEEPKPVVDKPKKNAAKPAKGGALTDVKPVTLSPKQEEPKKEPQSSETIPPKEPTIQEIVEQALRNISAEVISQLDGYRKAEADKERAANQQRADEESQRSAMKYQQESMRAEEDDVLTLVASIEQEPRQVLLKAYERAMKLIKSGL